MGSLMAGWDSTVKDPTTVMCQRNKSLTREEIDAYWKLKKRTEEEHLKAISKQNMHKASSKIQKRSSSLPLTDKKGSQKEELLSSKSCWWTRSNLAFLNEPPAVAIEGPYKYASQYDIAKLGSSQAINNTQTSN